MRTAALKGDETLCAFAWRGLDAFNAARKPDHLTLREHQNDPGFA
jgi:hypothetical protein